MKISTETFISQILAEADSTGTLKDLISQAASKLVQEAKVDPTALTGAKDKTFIVKFKYPDPSGAGIASGTVKITAVRDADHAKRVFELKHSHKYKGGAKITRVEAEKVVKEDVANLKYKIALDDIIKDLSKDLKSQMVDDFAENEGLSASLEGNYVVVKSASPKASSEEQSNLEAAWDGYSSDWISDQANDVVKDAYDTFKMLPGAKAVKISKGAFSSFFLGGGMSNDDDFLNYIEMNYEYDSGATRFQDNSTFYSAIGLTADSFSILVAASV